MSTYLLAIDQGTSSSRAILFNAKAEAVSSHQVDLKTSFPQDGWVEQDPEEMWEMTLRCCQEALRKASVKAKDVAAIGISNQRETTLIWDKKTGKALYPAIVWQDRRTAAMCKQLSQQPIASTIQTKTGLLLDPYFSATKIAWILDHVPEARARAERGELAFGTVDTFLLWRFTKGQAHITDATNASRTLLFNLEAQQWDDEILSALKIPKSILPQIYDSAADFGVTHADFFGAEIPISAMVGDQQAAAIGQACFEPGMVKVTYGTGCFVLLNTGTQIVHSQNRLLTTMAYRLQNKPVYCLEGSIFSAGTTVKWLRDNMHIIETAAETESLASSVENTGGVYLVPAFTGLGAPYWDPDARGAILGITRHTQRAHIARAALEAVCFQTRDLMTCMLNDGVQPWSTLRADGGMAVNNWLLQFLSDILHVKVQRPASVESSALGAIFLAGLQVGIYQSLEQISSLWQAEKSFSPQREVNECTGYYQGWLKAVKRIVT